MKFKEKYTIDKTIEGEEEKTKITPESFAVCEMIDALINKMEHTRRRL